MVVPFGEREYYRARPSIAIARPGTGDDGALDLDGFFGFNPRLGRSSRSGTRGSSRSSTPAARPTRTRSHFDAQDYMETATPGVKSTPDGWLNRYLQARARRAATPFRAVALTPQLPRMLQGTAPALAIEPDRRSSASAAARRATAVGASFEARVRGGGRSAC